jgi:hypothetical protein
MPDPALRRAKDLLNSLEPGSVLDGENKDLLLSLLARHPEGSRKTTGGVKDIVVMTHAKGGKCFGVVGSSGGPEGFSLRKCEIPAVPEALQQSPMGGIQAAASVVEVSIRVKAAKVSVPMRAEQFPVIQVAEGAAAPDGVDLTVQSGDISLQATLSRKGYRKAAKAVSEGGGEGYVVLQGTLGRGGVILDPGLTFQPPRTD